MNRGGALILLLLLVAGLTGWLAYDRSPSTEPAALPASVRAAEVITRDTWFTTMGAEGLPARTLRAAEARYYGDALGTELAMPHLTVYREEGPPWEVYARRGWVKGDGASVRLEEDVVLERASAPGVRPARLTTERLRINLNDNYAETGAPVTIVSESDRVDAVGMKAWLGEPSRVKFLSMVRGYYEPR
ncbi:MAG: LPS export ABC transporter periplasmic protein LptC [Gammaproteobacteria bacterium]